MLAIARRGAPLLLSLGFAAASAAAASEPGLLSTCTNCWPLSSASPGSLMSSDGAGGTYVVWLDGRLRWRLQRLRADLSIPEGWPAAGFALHVDRDANRLHPALAPDGEGGVFVTWAEQDPSFDMSVWLIRIRPDGAIARGWPESGLRLGTPAPLAWHPALIQRGSGVAVAWLEARHDQVRIAITAVDRNGRADARWPAEGHSLIVPAGSSADDFVLLASDGRAGCFVGWMEMRDRLSDLRAAHVPGNGGAPRRWTIVPRAVPVHAMQMDDHPELVADGLGGAIVSWTDERGQDGVDARHLMDVFAQRIASSGESHWTSGAARFGYQKSPHVVSDGRGGAYFSWNEHGPLADVAGWIQHLDARGRPAAGWPERGAARGLEVAGLVADGDGGAYATWVDSTGAFLERFSPVGAQADSAFPLGRVEGRTNVRIAPDGRSGVFMAWEERDRVQVEGQFRSKVWIQHLDLATRVASPILPLPTEPALFAVHPIAPNPARDRCRIAFHLPVRSRVDVEVFDVAGRQIVRLGPEEELDAGPQSLEWSLGDHRGRRVPAGLYLVRVTAGSDRGVVRVAITP